MLKRKYSKLAKKAKYSSHRLSLWIKIVAAIFIIITLLLEIFVQPSIKSAINYEAKNITTAMISDTVYDILKTQETQYDKLVHITKNTDNSIASIESNSYKINLLKSQITSRLTENLQVLQKHNYNICMGTLSGSAILAGRGPSINLRLEPTGFIKSEIKSQFQSVGINQTEHKIMLDITVEMNTFLPLQSGAIEVNASYLLAETIIVGDVPQWLGGIENKQL